MKDTFFSEDGSYGSTKGKFMIIDTEHWSARDWERIDEASDYQRVYVAQEIEAEWTTRRRQEATKKLIAKLNAKLGLEAV
jgi:hypothetical protein